MIAPPSAQIQGRKSNARGELQTTATFVVSPSDHAVEEPDRIALAPFYKPVEGDVMVGA